MDTSRPLGSSFQVLTFATKTGDFQKYNGLFISGQIGLVPSYAPSNNPVNLTLTTSDVVNDWISAVSGDWDTASNWTYGVPVAGQSVAIPYSGITVTHTQATAEPMIASLDDLATLNITSGSIALGDGSSTLGSVTIGAGASLSVGSGASVQIPEGETLTDNGTLELRHRRHRDVGPGCCSAAELVVAGTLTATGTTFTDNGSQRQPSWSTPAASSPPLAAPSTCPSSCPTTMSPSLAAGNNVSFDQIEIDSGTLPSGNELDLNLIGTNTANLSYIFPGGFTVGSGATLKVGTTVPVQVPEGETLTDNGTLSFATGDMVTLGPSCGYGRAARRRRHPDRHRHHLHRQRLQRPPSRSTPAASSPPLAAPSTCPSSCPTTMSRPWQPATM